MHTVKFFPEHLCVCFVLFCVLINLYSLSALIEHDQFMALDITIKKKTFHGHLYFYGEL